MIQEFINLSKEESELLLKAPVYVTILIAGVDENIEKSETTSGIKFADFLSKNADPVLKNYYHDVNRVFKGNLIVLLEKLPLETRYRNVDIAIELEKLNSIFPKLDKNFGVSLYESLLSFAKHVAKSSGGFLSMGTISPIEKAWITLDMINDPREQGK